MSTKHYHKPAFKDSKEPATERMFAQYEDSDVHINKKNKLVSFLYNHLFHIHIIKHGIRIPVFTVFSVQTEMLHEEDDVGYTKQPHA